MSELLGRDGFAVASAITDVDFDPGAENPKAEQLIGLVRQDELERAADDLFEFARREVRSKRLFELNALLKALRPHVGLSVEFALAVLTATLAFRSRLAERPSFVLAVEDSLRAAGRQPSAVLAGLV
jgi:PAS domain-containing protein